MKFRRTSVYAAVLAQVFMLAACGGGGGTMPTVPDDDWTYPNPPAPPGPPAAPKPSDAPQYSVSPSLKMTGYTEAHDAGYKGAGVTVAVIDTGFDRAAYGAEFGARLLPGWDAVLNQAGVNDEAPGGDMHGTKMTRVIAGSGVWPNDPSRVTMVGLAPDANIYPVKASDNGFITHQLQAYDHLRTVADVKIVNMSYGGGEEPPQEVKDGLLGLKNAGKLMVAAAGNTGCNQQPGCNVTEPAYPARYAADQDLASHMIVAGSVDINKNLAGYSHPAGSTMNRYLVAPDYVNTGTPDNPEMSLGTSVATAVVSGAAAVVWGRWPYLTADRVANILLETAEDLGAPGTDPVYGRGLLRLDRAMSPRGDLIAQSPSGQTLALGTLAGTVPGAAHQALEGVKVQMLDDYGRNFEVSAQHLLGRETQANAAQQRDAMMLESREVRSVEQGGLSFAWAGAGGRGSPWAKVGFASGRWSAHGYGGAMFVPLAIADNPVMGRLREASGVEMALNFDGLRASAGVVAGRSLVGQHQSALHAGLSWGAGPWILSATFGQGVQRQDDLDAVQNQTTLAVGADWQSGAQRFGVALHQGAAKQALASGLGSTQTVRQALVLRYSAQDVGRDGARLSAALTAGAPVRTKMALDLPTRIDAQTGALGFERIHLATKGRAPLRLDLAWSAPLQKGTLALGASASNTAGAAASVSWSRPF